MSRPIDWGDRFARRAPTEVEIGFGNGEYLIRRAQAHPDRDFVGLELKWGSLRRALRGLNRSALSNVRVVQVDARVGLDRLFSPRSVARFYSLFPCPWPKERHSHHRLFTTSLLRLMNSRLEDGGTALIATDHAAFRDEILSNVEGSGLGCRMETVPPQYDTKYERRWREQGQQEFYELHFWKESHPEIPVAEDVELVTYYVTDFDPQGFAPEGERGKITVEFKDFLYDPVRYRAMVAVFASEEGLAQRFWIEIARQKGGSRWAIFPAPGCGVVPVVSVQRALDLLKRACG